MKIYLLLFYEFQQHCFFLLLIPTFSVYTVGKDITTALAARTPVRVRLNIYIQVHNVFER